MAITGNGAKKDYTAVMEADRDAGHPGFCGIPQSQGRQDACLRQGETLLAAPGACVKITARKYLNRDGLDYGSVQVRAEMQREESRTRISVKAEVSGGFSGAVRERIVHEAASCPVCRILGGPIELAGLNGNL